MADTREKTPANAAMFPDPFSSFGDGIAWPAEIAVGVTNKERKDPLGIELLTERG